jgi:hypothetical protein
MMTIEILDMPDVTDLSEEAALLGQPERRPRDIRNSAAGEDSRAAAPNRAQPAASVQRRPLRRRGELRSVRPLHAPGGRGEPDDPALRMFHPSGRQI